MIYVSLQSWYWFKYKIHSAAIMGKSTAAPKKAVKPRVTGKAKALRLRLLANLQELRGSQ